MSAILVKFQGENDEALAGVKKYQAALDKRGQPHRLTNDPTVVIAIAYDADQANLISEALREISGEVNWEVSGLSCPEHKTLTTSAYDPRAGGEVWKCFERGCRYQLLVQGSGYLTMGGLLRLRRSTVLQLDRVETGRMSVKEPNFEPRRKEPKDKDDEISKLLEGFDFSSHEMKVLGHFLSELLQPLPRNWREFGTLIKAAEALKNGVPVAFETTPEGTDKLDEAVCRARSGKDMQDSQVVVQFRPMPHVVPEQVMEMAKNLKETARQSGFGRSILDRRPPRPDIYVDTEGVSIGSNAREIARAARRLEGGMEVCQKALELIEPVVQQGKVIVVDSVDRAQIEAVKAQMLGQAPKGATVIEIAAMKANETKAQHWPNPELMNYKLSEEYRREIAGEWKTRRDLVKNQYFGGHAFGRAMDNITPEQAQAMLDEYFKAWPDTRKYMRQMAAIRNFALLYGAGHLSTKTLLEKIFGRVLDLDHTAREQENHIAELERKNLELQKKVDQLTEENDNLDHSARGEAAFGEFQSKKAEVYEAAFRDEEKKLEEVRKMVDRLIRTVAGMNLQDQPLSVQREVREAIHEAMELLKGTKPA